MNIDDRMRGAREEILARAGTPSAELGGIEDRVLIATFQVLGERNELRTQAQDAALAALRTFYDGPAREPNDELTELRKIVMTLNEAERGESREEPV